MVVEAQANANDSFVWVKVSFRIIVIPTAGSFLHLLKYSRYSRYYL